MRQDDEGNEPAGTDDPLLRGQPQHAGSGLTPQAVPTVGLLVPRERRSWGQGVLRGWTAQRPWRRSASSRDVTTRSCCCPVIPGNIGSDRISLGGPLAHREVTAAVTQVGHRRGEVHRHRVVDAGTDTVVLHAFAARRRGSRTRTT